ncbi:MAG: lipocalin-like domain-containing protein [Deltaproteobacteria bacterium]|nr:lipocalin-like domain-containing protein [Deltaproteobacteria bacterium]
MGTWVLAGIERQLATGDWVRAETRLGNNPLGSLVYDSAGNMAVQIMRQERPLLSSNGSDGSDGSDGPAKAPPVAPEARVLAPVEKKVIAFEGYAAYFGKYSVNEAEGVVTHHRIAHLVPNQVGSDVERHFEFLDDSLVLAVPGQPHRLVWRRAD